MKLNYVNVNINELVWKWPPILQEASLFSPVNLHLVYLAILPFCLVKLWYVSNMLLLQSDMAARHSIMLLTDVLLTHWGMSKIINGLQTELQMHFMW